MKPRGIRSWAIAVCLAVLCGPASAAAAGQAAPASETAAAYRALKDGRVDQAEAGFQAALSVRPDDGAALAGMGQVRMLQGNYLGAVSFLERARQASPNDANIAEALDSARFSFLMGEGRDAQTAKDNEDAEKRYREALELRPGARDAVNALVNALVLENKLSDAQDALSTAVAREASASGQPPADLEMQLAQLDIANNEPQLAYPIFLQVLQDDPERTDAWSGLVSALHLMGHDADAVAQERAIPEATRTELEATPGFQQMMTAMATAPAQATPSGPSYAPFVPGPAPAPAATQPVVAAQPAAVSSAPATRVAIVPPVGVPQRSAALPSSSVSAKPRGARPASASPAPKPVAAAPSQPVRTPPATAQASAPSRPASSAGGGAPLVTQPAARPPSRDEVPDTGEQQYPQPKARPRPPANSPPAQN